MCGFAGCLISQSGDGLPYAAGMLAAQRHRGPDAGGSWAEGGVLLTHNRLSIIDLTAAANQPFHSQDQRYVLTYNGEIYNFLELKSELAANGCTFRTNSDTEVLVEAIAYWGLAAIARFNGMFAFACWDRVERKLVLARDRFGIKPLYLARTDVGVFFGSEIKSLLSCNVFANRLNAQGLSEFIWFGNALGNNTLFEGVGKVLPGDFHVFSEGGEAVHHYWHPSLIQESLNCSLDSADRLRELLDASVERQLIADVPVGIFLSGGIDSSAITGFAVKHSSARINTYSVEFDYALGESELAKAAKVARHFGTSHHEIRIQSDGLPDILEHLVRAHDQPFGDAANIPLYLLTRKLAGSLKVVLQGDGGDEIFGGYRRYQTLSRLATWRVLAKLLRPILNSLPKRALFDRARRYCNALLPANRADVMALLMTVEDPAFSPLRVFSPDFRSKLAHTNPFIRYQELEKLVADRDAVQAMLYLDTSIVLPDLFLEKVDRATMANSMEVRVPFLDNDLVDFALALPAREKLADGQLKGLLKAALSGMVPQEILDGPKTGFGVPYQKWLRGPLQENMRCTLLDQQTPIASILDKRAVTRLIDHHVAGVRDHGFLLWKLMQLSIWMTAYNVASE